jgi:phosphonate transport system substrate-binding protein
VRRISKQISEEVGFKVSFKTALEIPTVEKRLAAGKYGFNYMNPHNYTVLNQTFDYQVLTMAHDKLIRAVLVVRKDSAIEQIFDLNSSTPTFPAPAAFVVSVNSQSKLNVSSVKFKPKYVSSHDSVYRTVAKGPYLAGSGVIPTFNKVPPEIRDQLRVLWTSRGYTPNAIVAHLRVKKRKAHSLQQAFVKIDQWSEGTVLLKDIKINEFEMAQDSGRGDVRDLELKELSNI